MDHIANELGIQVKFIDNMLGYTREKTLVVGVDEGAKINRNPLLYYILGLLNLLDGL